MVAVDESWDDCASGYTGVNKVGVESSGVG